MDWRKVMAWKRASKVERDLVDDEKVTKGQAFGSREEDDGWKSAPNGDRFPSEMMFGKN
jgi:hypothetical protein